MYRVLHILADADAGGISAVVLNYYQHIDRDRIRFDFALTNRQDGMHKEYLQKLGSHFYELPLKSKGIRAFENALENILRKHHYDAVHVHESETCYVALRVAKRCGVQRRFAHSHTSSPYYSLKGEVRRLSGCLLNACYATALIACGKLAGDRVFGKQNMKSAKAVVLPNAIDTDKFAFDQSIRDSVRKELGVEGRYVIGMVGRLSPEKNHAFALQIIEKYHDLMPNVVLVLAGSGDEEKQIKEVVEQNGMENYVLMLGSRSDVNRLYQGFDVAIMPSIHEGFPVAAVEAMASGLPVLLSSAITRELSFGSNVYYLDLNDDEQWLEALEKSMNATKREQLRYEVRANGLDIRDTAKILEKLYLEGKR